MNLSKLNPFNWFKPKPNFNIISEPITNEDLKTLIENQLKPKDPLTQLAEDAKLIPDRYCKNCKAPWWEDYSECHQCTPKEVLKASEELVDARVDASKIYEEQTKSIKENFIDNSVKDKLEKYVKLYNLHKPTNYKELRIVNGKVI